MGKSRDFFNLVQSGELRESIEIGFGHWGRFTYRRAWLIIFISAVFITALLPQLKNLHIDTTTESFFHDDDPAKLRYLEFKEQYGRDDHIIFAIEGENVFSLDFLTRLRKFHQTLVSEVPFFDDIDSLINARMTVGQGDELLVGDFLAHWPQAEEDVLALKQQALNNPLYLNNYFSSSHKVAAIYLKLDSFAEQGDGSDLLLGFEDGELAAEEPLKPLSDSDNQRIRQAIDRIIAQQSDAAFRIYPSSGAYLSSWFVETITNGMAKYTGLAIACIAFMLFVIFRRLAMILLPLLVAVLSMLCSLSVTALAGITLSFSLQIVPSFLIAVGVGNSVHLFTIFYRGINEGKNKEDALAFALQHSGLAIFMTGMTTAGGLLSFLSSNVKAVTEFGLMTPMGVIFALAFSLILLPALMAVFPLNMKIRRVSEKSVARDMILAGGSFSVRNPGLVLGGWLLLVAIGIAGATQLQFSFNLHNNLPADHFVIKAVDIINENLAGSDALEIIVDSGAVNGVKNPEFLKRLDQIHHFAQDFEMNGYTFKKVISIVDVCKELNQALHGNNPDYYFIPDDAALVSQELLLFENSGADDLEKLVDSQFRYARVTMVAPMVDGAKYNPVLASLTAGLTSILGEQYSFEATGIMNLSSTAFNGMFDSMVRTYILAIIIITPLMILLIGSVKVGLVCMLPNLAPIIITLGIMGVGDIYLNGATLLTGSIALGLVVDDTIHFMHNFQRYFHRCGDVGLAVEQTLETTGQAIFFTTIVLSTAFMAFAFNEIQEWADFGIVTSLCILIALFADVLLAPALVTLLNRKSVMSASSTGKPGY